MNSNIESSGSDRDPDDKGMLVLLGTPLGNLADLSQRSKETLANADVYAAEDTRRLRVLLSHLGISGKRVMAIDANREAQMSAKVVEMVESGSTVVFTTDAGMPGVSDPGAKLVNAVARAGLRVDAVPGPSAPILAAALSGLCEKGFLFIGFPPARAGARAKLLESIAECGYAVIAFESPNRIGQLLDDAREIFGSDHPIFVGRELTKFHQEVFHGTLDESLRHFGATTQRGEFVVVFGPKTTGESDQEKLKLLEEVTVAMSAGNPSTKALAGMLSELAGISKNIVYAMLLAAQERGST